MMPSRKTKTYKVGDIVKLKSGGPVMTVKVSETHYVGCQWFIGKILAEGLFLVSSLAPPETENTIQTQITPSALTFPPNHTATMQSAVSCAGEFTILLTG